MKLAYYFDLPRDHFPIYGMDYLTNQQQSPVPQTAMAFFRFPFSAISCPTKEIENVYMQVRGGRFVTYIGY